MSSSDTPSSPSIAPEVALELGLDRGARVRRIALRVLPVALLLAFAVAGALLLARWWADPPTTYRTAAVTRGSVAAVVSATGTLEPVRTVSVAPEVSGRIEAVHVDFNDRVEEGQLLVELDPSTILARRAEARAQLRSARAQVRQSLATLEQARRTSARMTRSAAHGISSTQSAEEAQTSVAQAEATLGQSRAQVALALAGLQSIEADLARTTIESPVSGVVLRRSAEPGQTLAATFQPPELMLLAEDLRAMRLFLQVDEADIGGLEVGQTAHFTVDAFPDRRFAGRLVEIRNAPRTVQGVVSYEVVIEVDNGDGVLRPGMTATADVVTARRDDALLVPNEALRFTPPGEADAPGDVVWLENGDGVRAVSVEVGITDGHVAELLAGDLDAGQLLLVDLEREDD